MAKMNFDHRILVRCPPWLPIAVKQAAHKAGCKPSEYVRQAVLSRLKKDGVETNSVLASAFCEDLAEKSGLQEDKRDEYAAIISRFLDYAAASQKAGQ